MRIGWIVAEFLYKKLSNVWTRFNEEMLPQKNKEQKYFPHCPIPLLSKMTSLNYFLLTSV